MTSIRNDKGSYLPFMAFSCLAMAFGIGLMVDVGRIYVAKQRLQNAMDATLIGVGEKYIKDRTFFADNSSIRKALKLNFKGNLKSIGLDVPAGSEAEFPCSQTMDQSVQRTDIIVTVANPKPKLAIDCDISVPTLIMDKLPSSLQMGTYQPAAHPSTTPIALAAEFSIEIEGGGKPLIAVLVIDMSESVNDWLEDRVKPAAEAVLDELETGDYLAVTTFNKGYNGGQRNNTPGNWFTNVIAGFHEVSPQSKTVVANLIEDNIVSANIVVGSFGQGGLYMGRKMIKALNNGSTTRDWNDYRKVIFFISDGKLTESIIPADETAAPPVVTGPIVTQGGIEFDPFESNKAIKPAFPPRVILNTGHDPDDPWAVTNAANSVVLPSNIDLRLGWTHSCGQSPWGFPMAARESDLARLDGIEVFSFCTECKHAPNEAIMRRIAADQDLNNWERYNKKVSEMNGSPDLNGDGDQDWYEYLRNANAWKIPSQTTAFCSGYDKNQYYDNCWAQKPTSASGPVWDCAVELPIHLAHRQRFYLARFGVTGEELEDIVRGVIQSIKTQGRLSR